MPNYRHNNKKHNNTAYTPYCRPGKKERLT